jgi:hypothetical protein
MDEPETNVKSSLHPLLRIPLTKKGQCFFFWGGGRSLQLPSFLHPSYFLAEASSNEAMPTLQ